MLDRAIGDATRVEVGSAVRRARQGVGLTTRELAARTDVSQAMISMIENGRTTPSISTLFKLAEALGVRAQHLLPTTGSAEPRSTDHLGVR